MDKQFLEFWGTIFLNSAKVQGQLEEIAKVMRTGFESSEEFLSLFRKIYGLEMSSRDNPAFSDVWIGAQEQFQKSFRDFLDLFGVVPREEYLALVKKYEELKQVTESQNETIRHLRMLLSESKREGHHGIGDQVEELVRAQSDQFQKLMESFGQMYKKHDPAREDV